MALPNDHLSEQPNVGISKQTLLRSQNLLAIPYSLSFNTRMQTRHEVGALHTCQYPHYPQILPKDDRITLETTMLSF